MKKAFSLKFRENPGFYVGVIIYTLAFFFPLIFKSAYYQNVAIVSMCNAVLGIAFLIGLRAGLVNMTIPVFWGIGAYASSIIVRETGMSTWLALPLALIVALALALGLGYVLISSGSSGFAFVMLTQVCCMMFPVLIGNIKWFGGNNGFAVEPFSPIFGIDFVNNKTAAFYVTLIMLGIIIVVAMCFYAAWCGRAWTAIGMDARLADSIGINRFRYKLMAYVVASVLCAFCGCIYVHYKQFLEPSNYTMWKNIYVQIYAIMGGTAYPIAGPVTGGVIMNLLPEWLRFTSTLSPLIMGIVLILIIQYLPKGVISLVLMPFEIHKRRKNAALANGEEKR